MKTEETKISTEEQNEALLQAIVSRSVSCDFCDFTGNKNQLLKNGHCPKCQSPTTKNK